MFTEIANGAEARIYTHKLFDKTVVTKQRIEKEYRDKLLDNKIIKQRTKSEAILLKKVKDIGLFSPSIYFVGKDKIVMEYLVNTNEHDKYLQEIGKNIAVLHNNNIIHGDLNLINIITTKEKGKKEQQARIYFIDFGLGFMSNKIEDKATDLLVLKKTLLSLKSTEKLWKDMLLGYEKETSNKEIINKIKEIESRGRYL
ncbi:MAG: KEOPS complex kinase/ATPase Bud32 [archaeon]